MIKFLISAGLLLVSAIFLGSKSSEALNVNPFMPPGYVSFCEKFSIYCSSGEIVKLPHTDALINDIKEVQNEINSYPYVEDTKRFGIRDYWQLINSEGGDCEDFALAKKAKLLELGYDIRALRLGFGLAVVNGERVQHVVLLVYTDKETIILDNLNPNLGKSNGLTLILIENSERWDYINK